MTLQAPHEMISRSYYCWLMRLLLLLLLAMPGPAQASDPPIDVGVAWQGKSTMPERVLAGMQAELAGRAPRIRLELRTELADLAELEGAITDFERSKQAMVILRSNGAQLLGQRGASIPAFIGAASHPVALGAALTMDLPKPNIAGVTYYLSARMRLEVFKQVYPALQTYVLLVEEGHPGASIDAAETAAAASELGLTGRIVFCATLEAALAAIAEAESDAAIIMGSQALLIDNAGQLVEAAGARPVFAYSEWPIEAGALAGLVANDRKLGQMLGAMLIDVLVYGRSMADMSIQTDPAPRLQLNPAAIQRFGSRIPFSIQSLSQAEWVLNSILNSAPAGIGMVEQRVFVQVNDAILRLTGYTQKELIGQSTRMLYATPEEYNAVGHEISLQVAEKGAGSLETRWLRRDGAIRNVTLSAMPLNPADPVAGLIFTVLDITDRKKAEDALATGLRWFLFGLATFILVLLALLTRLVVSLRQGRAATAEVARSGQMLALVMNSIPQHIYWKDRHSVYLGCNAQGAKVAGLADPAEIVGKTDYDLPWKKEEADFFRECDARVMCTGKPELHIIEPQLQANGKEAWLDTTKVPLRDSNGQVNGILVAFEDITERRVQEEQALRQAGLIRSLLDSIPDIIFFKDSEGVYLGCNQEFARHVGRSPDDIVGKTDYDLYSKAEADVFRRHDREMLKQNSPRHNEEWISYPDGRRVLLDTLKTPYRDAHQNLIGILGISRDITARRQADEEQARLQTQLQQAQKMESIGALAGGVAHDFNNMLGVIMGHAELGLMETDPRQPIYRRLDQILNVSRRSGDLVQQLLAFARKQVIAPRVLNLNCAVEEMLNMLRRLIGEHIHLIWRPDPLLWRVKLDPSQISQILVNLCVNARNAIVDTGNITIETRTMVLDEAYCTRIAECTPGEYVLLSFSDTGCGIPAESLPQIFDPFFTTREMGQGTGLGLATVYGIVRQNQGHITVYSEPGLGTGFTIYLPRSMEVSSDEKTVADSIPLPGGHETVLLVEDEPDLLEMGVMMLEKLGYQVISAATPHDALQLASAHNNRIDLLITDVIMPKMNGRELSSRLTAQFPHLRCLFMSGYTADIIAQRGVLDEGVQFIQKPFSLRQLAGKVREAVKG